MVENFDNLHFVWNWRQYFFNSYQPLGNNHKSRGFNLPLWNNRSYSGIHYFELEGTQLNRPFTEVSACLYSSHNRYVYLCTHPLFRQYRLYGAFRGVPDRAHFKWNPLNYQKLNAIKSHASHFSFLICWAVRSLVFTILPQMKKVNTKRNLIH